MQELFVDYLLLILVIVGLVMLSRQLRVAYPILLVLGGLAISLVPGFRPVAINPEVIFFIFLPPLLYEAAWQTSWKEFWRFRRIITSFAFPVVVLTSCAIALVSSEVIPGFTLALGFLLGGIISPPDAISATTIMRTVKVPKSYITVVEGESLMNDASSLVVFRFALAAIITGQFHAGMAFVNFLQVISVGIVVGLAIGGVVYCIHRFLPTTAQMDIVLSFVTPYLMYAIAERFHCSGVLAVVSGGLLLSNHRHTMLTHQSRVLGANVWTTAGFVMNGLVFLLIGLQLPAIISGLGDISLETAIIYSIAISSALILTRMACTFGAVVTTEFMGRFITVADPHPGWKAPLILGWAGMRGVVSLAAALSIPELLPDGTPFPFRNLILFITFVVILVTLVAQGLTLPVLIKALTPDDHDALLPEEEQTQVIRQRLAAASVQLLAAHEDNAYVAHLRGRYELELNGTSGGSGLGVYQQVTAQVLAQQRQLLHQMNKEQGFDEEVIRRHLDLIDLEETKLHQQNGHGEG